MSESRSYQPIQVHHVPIKSYESEWVELYDRLPTGRALQLVEARKTTSSTEVLSFITIALLVKAWSLTDYAGSPLPATVEAFNDLDIDMSRALAETAKARCSFLSPASPASVTATES